MIFNQVMQPVEQNVWKKHLSVVFQDRMARTWPNCYWKKATTACRIAAGSDEKLELGNLKIHRDWGWAPEYVEAIWSNSKHDRCRIADIKKVFLSQRRKERRETKNQLSRRGAKTQRNQK